MITVLSGDDTVLISNFINAKIKKYQSGEIYRFDTKNTRPTDIADLVNTDNLFSKKKLIILKPYVLGNIDFNESFLKRLKDDINHDMIIDLSSLSRVKKAIDVLKQYAKIVEYNKRPDYTNFNIADALLIQNNPKMALMTFETVENLDETIYGIIGAIAYNIRGIISVRSNNKFAKSLKPFVKKKFLKSTYTDKDLYKIYWKLFELESACKNYKRNVTIKDLFIDFVLENFIK